MMVAASHVVCPTLGRSWPESCLDCATELAEGILMQRDELAKLPEKWLPGGQAA